MLLCSSLDNGEIVGRNSKTSIAIDIVQQLMLRAMAGRSSKKNKVLFQGGEENS